MSDGIDWHAFDIGDSRAPCFVCARGPRDKALSITIDHSGHGVALCHRCGHVEWHRPDRGTAHRPGKALSRPVAPRRHETLSDYGRALWQACSGLAGTVGEAYLLARGCRPPPADGDLRYCAELAHPGGFNGPGLVALLSDALDRTPRSLFRAWVNADGTRAAIDGNRLLLKDHRKGGTVCRLWPDDAVTYGLGIAEGIETALSLAHASPPAWACIDAGNLRDFPILEGVEALTIAMDNDPAGTEAATRSAERWHAAGRSVYVIAPPTAGADLNDIAQEAAA